MAIIISLLFYFASAVLFFHYEKKNPVLDGIAFCGMGLLIITGFFIQMASQGI